MRRTELAYDAEKSQLRSVVGSLAWVARQARPDLSYRVNKLQSVCTEATLKDLVFANKTVADAKEISNHGTFYQAGILDFNNCILCTMSDASWSIFFGCKLLGYMSRAVRPSVSYIGTKRSQLSHFALWRRHVVDT